ncbi:MAG TPA: phosphatidylglycerophosphatase A [Acidobacteriaceae bacterium]|jgi:phosphatidylglycerophosphatase A|nr:phosphatidylglycerophosphatase A [Acidobacteriaceae bacterium]
MATRNELRPPGVRIREAGEPLPASRTRWAWWAATFFGAGRLKPGPGTWGSLAATAIWYFALSAMHLTDGAATLASLAGVAAVLAIGIPAATAVERESGRTDPGFVVIDEVAGQWLTLAVAPVEPWHALLGLVLFRLFDITKPWPARRLERLHGGTGIMLDDVAAGVYGLLVMLVIRIWW